MSQNERMTKAFNEWMRLYTEAPEQFEHQFRTVQEFLQEQSGGAEPSYGQACSAYLTQLMDQVAA